MINLDRAYFYPFREKISPVQIYPPNGAKKTRSQFSYLLFCCCSLLLLFLFSFFLLLFLFCLLFLSAIEKHLRFNLQKYFTQKRKKYTKLLYLILKRDIIIVQIYEYNYFIAKNITRQI